MALFHVRIGVGMIIAALLLVSPVQGALRQVTDQGITDAVEDEFRGDPVVPAGAIDVSTEKGIVTLSGRVGSLLASERAIRIAETVRGVVSVVDRLKIEPYRERSAEEILSDVRGALRTNPATRDLKVEIKVEEGDEVELRGEVASMAERRIVGKAARSVRGVTQVRNAVTLTYPDVRPPEDIAADVRQRILWDARIDPDRIEVSVKETSVHLGGSVASAAEKRIARRLAHVAGVNEVDAGELQVQPDRRRERPAKPAVFTDEEIRNAVQRALRQDPRVSADTLRVEVLTNVVTLRGVVDSLQAKGAAEQDARHTRGVRRVENRLKVRPGELPPPEKLKENVRLALLRDPYLERYEIAVGAEGPFVVLDGVVDSRFEKSRASWVAGLVEGVAGVENLLEVREDEDPLFYNPYEVDPDDYLFEDVNYRTRYTLKADWHIRDDIYNQLFWSPFVDADEVEVEVDDGVVTLTGVVDTFDELHVATVNAFEGGAIRVRNRLSVE